MIRAGLCLLLLFGLAQPSAAESPVPLKKVAPVDLVVAGLEEKMKTLEGLLEDESKYDDNELKIVRAGGVIACLAQALIEHEDNDKVKIAGPALRDAGLALQEYAGHEACMESLKTAQAAMKGESSGEHAKEHAWDSLISMYDMMVEMDERNGGISRSLRRPRGSVSEQLNASTNAILSLAMIADQSYVVDEEQAKKWDEWARQGREAMTNLITAIKERDRAKIAEYYMKGNRSCDQCHEVFRPE